MPVEFRRKHTRNGMFFCDKGCGLIYPYKNDENLTFL